MLLGREYKQQMARLNQAAESNGWQRQDYPGSQLICLRQSSLPFNDEEDLMVCLSSLDFSPSSPSVQSSNTALCMCTHQNIVQCTLLNKLKLKLQCCAGAAM